MGYSLIMSTFAKHIFRCVGLNVLQLVHLITVDVNEQRVSVVQPIENKRTSAEQWLSSS